MEQKGEIRQLEYEYYLYKLFEGGEGFGHAYYIGQQGDFNVMAMELMGPSLDTLFKFCERQFSEKTVFLIGLQILDRLEYI